MNNHQEDPPQTDSEDRGMNLLTAVKLVAASALFYSAGSSFAQTYHNLKHDSPPSNTAAHASPHHVDSASSPTNNAYQFRSLPRSDVDRSHRRLSAADPPSYMEDLLEDLKARKKLMEETPPEEVKYWFEYTGPLQVRALILYVL